MFFLSLLTIYQDPGLYLPTPFSPTLSKTSRPVVWLRVVVSLTTDLTTLARRLVVRHCLRGALALAYGMKARASMMREVSLFQLDGDGWPLRKPQPYGWVDLIALAALALIPCFLTQCGHASGGPDFKYLLRWEGCRVGSLNLTPLARRLGLRP